MYWADVIAERIIKNRNLKEGDKVIVASGITPSGHIHLGNAREVLTADAIYKALKERNINAELIFYADDYDPLRKVYPFLDQSYEKYVKMPLSEIPCPEGCCKSYADHFLTPFIESLPEFGIELKMIRASEMYKKGKYNEAIKISFENREKIREILNKFRETPLEENWFPGKVVCENCGKIAGKIIGYSNEKISYVCEECGYENVNVSPYNGRVKLSWRVDWPSRWWFLNVVAEPMGKDHGAAGGSYDTGKIIAKEIFNYLAPEKIVYEWIQLKKGDKAIPMSSSKGVVFAMKDWKNIAHAEVLRYLILRYRPNKAIDFDLKRIPNLVEDFDRLEKRYFEGKCSDEEKRIYEMSIIKKMDQYKEIIPYHFCAIISQLVLDEKNNLNEEVLIQILKRNGYNIENIDFEKLYERLIMAKNWALKYGEVIQLVENPKKHYDKLNETQKEFIKLVYSKLEKLEEFNSETIGKSIFEIIKSKGLNSKECFKALYLVLFGKDQGPKISNYFAIRGKEKIMDYLKRCF